MQQMRKTFLAVAVAVAGAFRPSDFPTDERTRWAPLGVNASWLGEHIARGKTFLARAGALGSREAELAFLREHLLAPFHKHAANASGDPRGPVGLKGDAGARAATPAADGVVSGLLRGLDERHHAVVETPLEARLSVVARLERLFDEDASDAAAAAAVGAIFPAPLFDLARGDTAHVYVLGTGGTGHTWEGCLNCPAGTYQEELVGSSVSVVYPKWFNATHDCEGDEDCSPNSWSEATEPRGAYISSFTFSVSWESEDEDRRRLAHAAAAAAPPAAAGAESRAAAAAAVAVAVICVTLTYVQNAAAARQREELRAELRAAREQTKADIAELLAAAGRPAAPGAKDAAAAAAT